jgi:hypothetical protein
MRLLTAHKILIATAAVFFFLFAFWEFKDYLDTANDWSMAGAVFYMLVAAALAVYFKSLRKWTQL